MPRTSKWDGIQFDEPWSLKCASRSCLARKNASSRNADEIPRTLFVERKRDVLDILWSYCLIVSNEIIRARSSTCSPFRMCLLRCAWFRKPYILYQKKSPSILLKVIKEKYACARKDIIHALKSNKKKISTFSIFRHSFARTISKLN